MIGRVIAARQYRRGLRLIEHGEFDRLLAQFDSACTMTFVGDTPLGADRLQGDDLRRWFERFGRLLPTPRFDVQRLSIVGPVWNQRLAAHVVIHSTVNGEPYSNQFAHFLRIRWGRVVDDLILEDTQRWERACRRLADAGVAEASAPPLQPTASAAA